MPSVCGRWKSENRKAEEAVGGVDAGPAALKELLTKNVWSAPALQGLFVLLSEAACVNVGMDGPTSPGCCLITRSGGDSDNGGGI